MLLASLLAYARASSYSIERQIEISRRSISHLHQFKASNVRCCKQRGPSNSVRCFEVGTEIDKSLDDSFLECETGCVEGGILPWQLPAVHFPTQRTTVFVHRYPLHRHRRDWPPATPIRAFHLIQFGISRVTHFDDLEVSHLRRCMESCRGIQLRSVHICTRFDQNLERTVLMRST